MSEFKVGDIVTLKSGSPCMTISHISQPEINVLYNITCQWFSNNGDVHNACFPSEALKKAPETKANPICKKG